VTQQSIDLWFKEIVPSLACAAVSTAIRRLGAFQNCLLRRTRTGAAAQSAVCVLLDPLSCESVTPAKLPDNADGLSRRNVLDDSDGCGWRIGWGAECSARNRFGRKLRRAVGGSSCSNGRPHARTKSAMIKGITDVVFGAMKQPADPSRRLFVQIFETTEGGFGVNGQAFVPRSK
jgi:hypothetical protein